MFIERWAIVRSQVNLCVFVGLTFLITGCSKNEPEPANENVASELASPDIESLASSYTALQLMTPEPVYVNPELAMLCIGATKDMVDDARAEKGPHANCLVKVFMNELAASAFRQELSYPVGSVIVKEKSMLGYLSRKERKAEWVGQGDGVGGMIKRQPGYDKSNGDWEYFYFDDPTSIESGKIKNCVDCHRRAQDTDFVFADWAEPNSKDRYGF